MSETTLNFILIMSSILFVLETVTGGEIKIPLPSCGDNMVTGTTSETYFYISGRVFFSSERYNILKAGNLEKGQVEWFSISQWGPAGTMGVPMTIRRQDLPHYCSYL